jgi:HSP20 family protein
MSPHNAGEGMQCMHHRIRKWVEQLSQHRMSSCLCGDVCWIPSADILETQAAYHVVVDLAGVDATRLEVVIQDNTLYLQGERSRPQVSESIRIHQLEIDTGTFRRDFYFPVRLDADTSRSVYRDGFLEIILPKLRESISIQVPFRQD